MSESFQGVIALLFDESSSFSAPSAFGTYRVLHQVGSGVLGPVFRTCDPRHPDLVAVKAFKLDLRPEQVVRLADALRRLVAGRPEHPAVAGLLDAGLEGTTPFLATEYLVGDTLDVVLRRGAPLTLDRVLELLTPIGAAIDAAWSVGVGHGTLHPRDVFVGPDGHGVKLTGLGVAQALESAELAVPIRRAYAAPERARGPWDIRADVYSLGGIAHELLTGRRPAGPAEQDGVFAPEVSPEQRVAIRRVLSTALAEQPDDRFASAGAFVAALAGLEARVPAGWPLSPPETEPLDAAPNDDGVDAPDDSDVVDIAAATAASRVVNFERQPAASSLYIDARGTTDEAPDEHGDEGADFQLVPIQAEPRMDLLDAPRIAPSRPAGGLFFDVPQQPASRRLTDVRPAAPDDDLGLRPGLLIRPPAGFLAGDESPGGSPARQPSKWRTVAIVGLLVGVGGGYLAGTYRSGPASAPAPLTDQPAKVADAEALPAEAPLAPAHDVIEPASVPEAPSVPPADAVPAAVPAPAPKGALAIRSQPSGAMVTLDGRLVGETPLVLRDLPVGPYTLQVARPGYAPRSQRVTVSAGGAEHPLTFALEAGITSPATQFGGIDVDSSPRGARVIVDGRFIGEAPLRVPELRPGEHTVILELANRATVTRRTVVRPGEIAKLIVAMP